MWPLLSRESTVLYTTRSAFISGFSSRSPAVAARVITMALYGLRWVSSHHAAKVIHYPSLSNHHHLQAD